MKDAHDVHADSLAIDEDEDSQVENAAPRCAACIECAAKRENVSAGEPSWESIPFIETPEEVIGYPGLQQTDDQHVADLDGILAWYDFAAPIRVRCSLKGRHRHAYGVVVRMLCDLTVCMGKDCGKKSIVGFEAVHRAVQSRVQFQKDKRYLEGWTTRYKERIGELHRPLRARHDVLETIQRLLPELHVAMTGRCSQGAAGAAVEVRGGQREETRHLAGLQLFRRSAPREEDMRRALARFEEATLGGPPIDGPAADALLRLAKTADDRADAAKEWVRETASFLTEENLALALVALRHENPSIERLENGFRVGYMPGRTALLPFFDVRTSSPRVP